MASYTGGSREETRIRQLEGERAARKQDILQKKGAIANASAGAKSVLAGRNFAVHKDNVEDLLKSDTVGLVTHDDFKARREYLERSAADEMEKRNAKRRVEDAKSRKLQLRKANASKLSFAADEDDDSDDSDDSDESEESEEREAGGSAADKRGTKRGIGTGTVSEALGRGTEVAGSGEGVLKRVELMQRSEKTKRRRVTKNPDADTDFLPDRDRELAEETERERLKQEWINEQERRKNELVNITYSYWDGSGHRRMIRCKKGTTIGRFLGMVQTQFKDLRGTSSDELVFIKEDLIIPHHYSFYDFIVSKARGKSGPLFNFDVVEDIRLVSDANKEKQDAHAAKVVERRWYDRNRHIFPASRWTTFDPKKKVRVAHSCLQRNSSMRLVPCLEAQFSDMLSDRTLLFTIPVSSMESIQSTETDVVQLGGTAPIASKCNRKKHCRRRRLCISIFGLEHSIHATKSHCLTTFWPAGPATWIESHQIYVDPWCIICDKLLQV